MTSLRRLPPVKPLAASPRIHALFANMEGSKIPVARTALLEEDKEIIQNTTKVLGLTILGFRRWSCERVFLMRRSQLQRRKQSTHCKRFDTCSAWFRQFSILLGCSVLS